MKGSLLFIGNELLSGMVENINSGFAVKELNFWGLNVEQIVTIPDRMDLIIKMLRILFNTSDFLIVSGGLGPTDDDITNLAVAKAFKLKLKENPLFSKAIMKSEEYKDSQEFAIKMAILPEGAVPLSKDLSSAGYLLEIKNRKLFFLPGVPSQFAQLLKEEVIPRLLKDLKQPQRYYTKVLRFFDVNETEVNQIFRKKDWDIEVGYYPVFPEVKVVLRSENLELLEKAVDEVKNKLRIHLISEKDQGLPEIIGQILTEKKSTLVVAESCTGGLLSSLITSVPGSSAYFERGFVTYSPRSKVELLGVSPDTIERFDVVSYEVALEMAEGARKKTGADYSIGITGFAGPTGGTSENPVGTVYIGFSYENRVKAIRFAFSGTRKEIQILASYTALDILRRKILYGEGILSYRLARGIKEKTL